MALDVPVACFFQCAITSRAADPSRPMALPSAHQKRNRPCSSFPARIAPDGECRRAMQILLRSREDFSEMTLLVPLLVQTSNSFAKKQAENKAGIGEVVKKPLVAL